MIALVFPFRGEMDAFLHGFAGQPASAGLTEQMLPGLTVFSPSARPDWVLVVCGEGGEAVDSVCRILYDHFSPDRYALIGSATALDPTLRVGDIVVDGRRGESGDAVLRVGETSVPGLRYGKVFTSRADVFQPQAKARIYRESGALALAKEGDGLRRFLERNRIQGLEIRCITETARDGEPERNRMRRVLEGAAKTLRTLVDGLAD